MSATRRTRHAPAFRFATALAWLAALSVSAHGQGAPGPGACSDLLSFQLPGTVLEITRVESLPAGAPPAAGGPPGAPAMPLPAHCRVEGVIDRREGVGGKPYGIGFAIALPDDWSGRFLFQGGGGLNGTVGAPIGATAAGDKPALARGDAVVATDSGHKGSVFDGAFFEAQQASLAFYYVAVGRAFPGRSRPLCAYPAHAHFTGQGDPQDAKNYVCRQ